MLFGCSDSRLAAEIVFDQGLGDLFVVRTAGHVVGSEVLGSIKCGVSLLDCPLVLVLGHDSCGAIAAARAAGRETAEGILHEHIRHTVDLLLDRSHILSERVAVGRLAVAGLSYRLADGSAQLVASHGLIRAAVPARRNALPTALLGVPGNRGQPAGACSADPAEISNSGGAALLRTPNEMSFEAVGVLRE
ncbi:carbonic anhydrase [Streptomyces sp. NBRC 110611]|nr:carbonic anhydrase [Streptomyces sp. NBRC 110611]